MQRVVFFPGVKFHFNNIKVINSVRFTGCMWTRKIYSHDSFYKYSIPFQFHTFKYSV